MSPQKWGSCGNERRCPKGRASRRKVASDRGLWDSGKDGEEVAPSRFVGDDYLRSRHLRTFLGAMTDVALEVNLNHIAISREPP